MKNLILFNDHDATAIMELESGNAILFDAVSKAVIYCKENDIDALMVKEY